MSELNLQSVQTLSNAYRSALLEGDERFGGLGDSLERKLLLAAVAKSAADCCHWVETRVADGSQLAAPLKELVPALQEGDNIGRGLNAAQASLAKHARDAVTSLLLTRALPVGLVSLALFVLGVFTHAQQAGVAVGKVAIPALIGSSALTITLLRMSQGVAGGLIDEWRILWAGSGGLGAAASDVYLSHVAVPLRAVGVPWASVVPTVGRVRLLARVVLLASALMLGVCFLYFVSGVWSAWEAYKACPFPQLPYLCQPVS